jgi:protein O-GlcNAc transferase
MTPEVQAGLRALKSGRLEDAERLAQQSVERHGEHAAAFWLRAGIRRRLARLREADSLLAAAIRLDPLFLPALQDLGALRMRLGDAEGALSVYRAAVAAAPTKVGARQGMLVAMHYCASVTAAEIAEAHRAAGHLFPDGAPPPARSAPVQPARPDGPVRIGFVSGDFRRHATLSFLSPLLQHLDRDRLPVTLYSVVRQPDDGTAHFRGLADRWVDAAAQPDAALAERIAADGIDVLVDLNGHTAGNRLGVFARRPAPVQATWLDYVHSTGLEQIDWFLTDADHVPADEDGLHVERPLRLAPGTFCFAPPIDAAQPQRRPAPSPSAASTPWRS